MDFLVPYLFVAHPLRFTMGKILIVVQKLSNYLVPGQEIYSFSFPGNDTSIISRETVVKEGRCRFIYYHTLDSSTEQYFQFIYSDNTLSSSTKKQYFPFIYWQYLQFIYEKTIPSIHLLTILSIHLLTIIPINFINNPHFRLLRLTINESIEWMKNSINYIKNFTKLSSK